jgi:hypothetical protein
MTNQEIQKMLLGEVDSVTVTGKQGAHTITYELEGDTQTLTISASKIVWTDHQINV